VNLACNFLCTRARARARARPWHVERSALLSARRKKAEGRSKSASLREMRARACMYRYINILNGDAHSLITEAQCERVCTCIFVRMNNHSLSSLGPERGETRGESPLELRKVRLEFLFAVQGGECTSLCLPLPSVLPLPRPVLLLLPSR